MNQVRAIIQTILQADIHTLRAAIDYGVPVHQVTFEQRGFAMIRNHRDVHTVRKCPTCTFTHPPGELWCPGGLPKGSK